LKSSLDVRPTVPIAWAEWEGCAGALVWPFKRATPTALPAKEANPVACNHDRLLIFDILTNQKYQLYSQKVKSLAFKVA
jgi:hypothetical protein